MQSSSHLNNENIQLKPVSGLTSKRKMNIQEAIYVRRSIRKFLDQPVETEKIDLLLKAAMAAPSAMNIQPWEFVIVTKKETLARIRSVLVYGKMNTPLAILVCGNLSKKNLVAERFWVQDCSAATQNILLTAVDLGLGAVWCGVHPIHLQEKLVSQILSLPAKVIPLNVIYVGYPAEEKSPRTQYDESKVHWEIY